MSALQDGTSCAKKRPAVSDSSAVVPLASPKVKPLQINVAYTPSSPEESPCPTDDELGELRNPKDELRKKRILKRQSSKEAQGTVILNTLHVCTGLCIKYTSIFENLAI